MSSTSEALRSANQEWHRTYNAGAYTSLPMLDLMLTNTWGSGSPGYAQFINKPNKILGKDNGKVDQADFEQYDLNGVTYNPAGRCTSFAILVADNLQRRHQNVYDWKYYDLKGHRIAVDHRNWIVIDSSSFRGAVQLPRDSVWTTWESDQKWKFLQDSKSGKTKFEMLNSQNRIIAKSSAEPISTGRCMRICMAEVAQRGTALVYFRAIDAESREPRFYGMISFNSNKKRFEVTPKGNNRARQLYIVFDGNEDRERSNDGAMRILDTFAETAETGGPNGRQQWGAPGVRSSIVKIMTAASQKYGSARLTYSQDW